jgi:5-methylcytosine-specific restriction endonuclease McrA
MTLIGAVAQLGERIVRNDEVTGSIPVCSRGIHAVRRDGVMLNDAVLLLNSTYEPLNVINVRRAIRLVLARKADPVEVDGNLVRAVSRAVPAPVVVRLTYYVRRPNQRVKFTKRTVLARDQYTCQYCGVQTRDLTLDHVLPRTLGGPTVWTNVVAACRRCNGAKGGRTLKESGLRLLRLPREPRFLPYLRMVKHAYQRAWDKYLFTDPESPFLLRGPLPRESVRPPGPSRAAALN